MFSEYEILKSLTAPGTHNKQGHELKNASGHSTRVESAKLIVLVYTSPKLVKKRGYDEENFNSSEILLCVGINMFLYEANTDREKAEYAAAIVVIYFKVIGLIYVMLPE